LKYLRSMTFGFQDIGIRIFEFVAKTQFLFVSPQITHILQMSRINPVYALWPSNLVISFSPSPPPPIKILPPPLKIPFSKYWCELFTIYTNKYYFMIWNESVGWNSSGSGSSLRANSISALVISGPAAGAVYSSIETSLTWFPFV